PSGRDPGLTRPLLGGGGGCPPRGADPCGVPEYESEAMPGLPPAGTDHGPPGRPAGAITRRPGRSAEVPGPWGRRVGSPTASAVEDVDPPVRTAPAAEQEEKLCPLFSSWCARGGTHGRPPRRRPRSRVRPSAAVSARASTPR